MQKRLIVACLSLAAVLGACKKAEPVKPATVPAPPAPKARPAAPTPSPAAAAVVNTGDAKVLLTEDKISRYATYQKEMLPIMGDAAGLGMAAYQKGGTDAKKFQGAMAADDRTAKIAAASQAALTKSGLSQDEVSKIGRIVTSYYARTYVMQDAVKKADETRANIAAAKAQGKQPSLVDTAMDKMYSEQLTRFEAARKEFATQYGEDALALVKKHEPEFFAINEKIMGATMKGLMRKP
jgi:hypothetical protein